MKLLTYTDLVAFFYEEPERFEEHTRAILGVAEDEEAIKVCLMELRKQDCTTTPELARKILAELRKDPPIDFMMDEDDHMSQLYGDEM